MNVCRCCGTATSGVAVATAAPSRGGHIGRPGRGATRCGGCVCSGSSGTKEIQKRDSNSTIYHL